LIGILINIPLSSAILCTEADGQTAIEFIATGSCLTQNDHEDCESCSDVDFPETLIKQANGQIDGMVSPQLMAVVHQQNLPVENQVADTFQSDIALANPFLNQQQTIVLLI